VEPAASRTKTVFISYSSRDRNEAFHIKQLLEANAAKVWLDFFNIQTSAELRQELASRVRQSELFCLLLSPNAVESRWVGEEVATALAAAKDGLRILPIILRPCRVPPELDNIVGFDASEGLEHDATRLRLVRAVCGDEAVQEQLLLDAATRLLLENKETLARAEEELPAVAEEMVRLAGYPIRKISLAIRAETLPDDPNVVLELRLKLDELFHGAISLYIAHYQEGRTWPEELGFKEPPFTEFFLADRPRLDVQFQWFDRVIPLDVQIDGTDLKTLPAMFTLEFTGAEFRPKGELNLPQKFEVPSLDALEKDNSLFRLIAHDWAAKQAREIPADTDIDVRLTAEGDQGNLCLYASIITPQQRVVLQSEYLGRVTHQIRKTAILQRYAGAPAFEDRRSEIVAALDAGEFKSDEQRRLAARYRFSEATLARFRTLHRDAYVKFQETAELLRPLVVERIPTLDDASLMYRACRATVETWLRQDSLREAGQLGETLGGVAQAIREADEANADFQRIWADAVLVNAEIHARLGDKGRAALELQENVDTLAKLNQELPSPERRGEYLGGLARAVRNAAEWSIADAVPAGAWQAALAAEVGDSDAQALTRPRPPNELPRWLEKTDLKGWPTAPLKSVTLRYALRIPAHWISEPEVRGTSREVEHVYHGKRVPEWLIITFMDKANSTSDMKNWVEGYLHLSGFPVLLKLDPLPKLSRWTYFGKLSGLATKLKADEAHAYTGLAEYVDGRHSIFGRMYLVMARRKSFAWKVALSLETACFAGMPEETVYSQDHVRAGVIFGDLRLGSGRNANPATK
jgi:hypothetical protein